MKNFLHILKTSLFLIVLLFLGCVFALTIGELTARKFKLSKTLNSYPHLSAEQHASKRLTSFMGQQYRKNSYLGFSNPYHPQLVPNKEVITPSGIKIHIDPYGFRNNFEYNLLPSKNSKRIIMIGDSVTFGYDMPEEKTFPTLLKQMFSQKQKIEILNFGIPGNDTYGNFYLIKKAVLEFSADLIVYQYGLNDTQKIKSQQTIPSDPKNRIQKSNKFKHLLSKSALYLFLAERYNYIKLKLGKNHWSFQEWSFSEDEIKQEFNHFKEIYHFLNKTHTPILFVFYPYAFQVYSPHPQAIKYQTIFKNFWKINHWPYLDLTPVFKQQKKPYDLFLDDVHLSTQGHAVVANTLFPHIHKILLNNTKTARHEQDK